MEDAIREITAVIINNRNMLKHVQAEVILGLGELLLEHSEIANGEHIGVVGTGWEASGWHKSWLHHYHHLFTPKHLHLVNLVLC